MSGRHGLEIRAAGGADAPGLAELVKSCGVVISPSALAERLATLRGQAGTALIAVEWGPPSGLVVLHWYQTLEAAQPTAQITTLLVGPDERRRGIGRLLVKAAAQAARMAGCGALEVSVTVTQPDLRGFLPGHRLQRTAAPLWCGHCAGKPRT